jgi:hypothetical protein
MNTTTRDLIEAHCSATASAEMVSPNHAWYLETAERRTALHAIQARYGLSEAAMKFCFWREEEAKRAFKAFLSRPRAGGKPTFTVSEAQYDFNGRKLSSMADDGPQLNGTDDDDNFMFADPERHLLTLVITSGRRAAEWQIEQQSLADEQVRLAAIKPRSKDAVRMARRRKAGLVKPRPPRPPQSVAQKVASAQQRVATQAAKLLALESEASPSLAAILRAAKSLRSFKKALATAERMTASEAASKIATP